LKQYIYYAAPEASIVALC